VPDASRRGFIRGGIRRDRIHIYVRAVAAWLIAILERLPPLRRRLVLSALAALALAAAIMSLTLETRSDGGARPSPPTAPAGSPDGPNRVLARVQEPVSVADLHRAAAVGRRFLRSYLPFAYGSGTAASVPQVTPELRRQQIRTRGVPTPAQRREHPRVGSLQTVGTMPGFVVATATIEDGGVAAYRLRFSLQARAGRWLVTDIREG
jgi:hypothetical protein